MIRLLSPCGKHQFRSSSSSLRPSSLTVSSYFGSFVRNTLAKSSARSFREETCSADTARAFGYSGACQESSAQKGRIVYLQLHV